MEKFSNFSGISLGEHGNAVARSVPHRQAIAQFWKSAAAAEEFHGPMFPGTAYRPARYQRRELKIIYLIATIMKICLPSSSGMSFALLDVWILGAASAGGYHLGAWRAGGTRPALGLASGILAIVSGLPKENTL